MPKWRMPLVRQDSQATRRKRPAFLYVRTRHPIRLDLPFFLVIQAASAGCHIEQVSARRRGRVPTTHLNFGCGSWAAHEVSINDLTRASRVTTWYGGRVTLNAPSSLPERTPWLLIYLIQTFGLRLEHASQQLLPSSPPGFHGDPVRMLPRLRKRRYS